MADYIYGQPDAADESNPYGKPAPKPSGALRKAVGDKVVGFASGAVGATKAIADAVGAGNVVSNTLENANQGINDYLSPEAKADQQAHFARSEQAKGTGAWNEFKTGVQNFAESPIQQTVTGVGSIVPVALAALGGLPAAAATGIAMGAGTVKGRIYDDTKKRGIDAGLSAADADAAATKAQNYTGENTDQIALGGALGAADALTGAGRVAGGMLRNAVMKPAISAIPKAVERGIVGRAAMGALGEFPLEAAQGGQEQLATNIAAQRQGVNVDTWSGVAGQATEEGLASLGSGAAFGVARGRNANTAPPGVVPPPAVPPAPPLQIGNTPDPYISFPDGTVARRSEADAYVNSLPADQQPAARAKLMGLAPQPAKPSEQMGLTPTAGPSLTNAAITAVDSGAAQVNIDQAPAEQIDIVEQQRQQYQQETAALLAQQDQEAFDAYLAAIEDANTALDEAPGESVQALSQLDDISVPDIFDANSNTSDADFLRAMGATEQEIADAITNQPGSPQAGTPNPVGTAQDEPGSTGQGVSADQTKQANLERIRKANNVSPPDSVQPIPATSSGQDGNQPAASVGLGSTDGNGLGANAGGSTTGSVDKPSELPRGALRTPVAQGKPQPTALGTQTNANAGPGFTAKDVQGVKNNEAPTTGAKAEAAPGEAPKAVAGYAATSGGVPAAGSAAVEGDGVEPKAKWLKAINDQNRLAGDTGVQLKVVDGKLTFYGDPKSTKQGRALEATLAEARKAGATQQEIIGSISQPAATNPAAGVGPASLGSAKADMDHLLGIDQKRTKALDRIAAGKAWWTKPLDAQEFITKNGLKDTHQSVKEGGKWYVRAKAVSQPTKSTNEKAPEAQQVQTKPEAGTTAGVQQPAAGAAVAGEAEGVVGAEPNLQAAKNLLAQQKAATGNAVAEGHIRKKLRDLAATTPQDHTATVMALDTAATRLGMGEGKLKGLEFAPATTPVSKVQKANGPVDGNNLNSPPMQELNGFKVGDMVDVPRRTTGRSKITRLYTYRHAMFPTPLEMATIEHSKGKHLEIGLGELQAVDDAAPAASKPEIVVDKAEMRPYRKPDGSVGYEAVPIQAATPAEPATKATKAETMRELAKVNKQMPEGFEANDGPLGVGLFQNGKPVENVQGLSRVNGYGELLRHAKMLAAKPATMPADAPSDEKPKAPTAETEQKQPPATAEPTPAATENVAKPDAKAVLSEREKAAKAKMFNALGKLATLAGKNTRMNWTQEEEQQLLPIVIELFDGAMELGAVTFQQAVAYVREFISSNLDQETADSIPFDTLQGAYISVAGRHKDKPVTSKKEVVSFESLAELENSTDKADTETKDTENDSGTEKQGSGALDGVSPGKVGGTGSRGSGGRGTKSGSTSRRKGNSSTDGKRGTPGRSGGNGTSDADSSSTGGAGGRRGIESDGGRVPANGGSPDVELASGSGRGVPKGQDGLFTESGEVIPAAVPAANFTITPDLKLGSGGEVTKYKDNIAAIRALKLIESEHRRATSEEQRVLARYVGWGGLANAFRNRVTGAVKADWANEVAELESLLTAKELKAASASTPNAHYTSETVTSFMWRAAVRLGYSGGMALESSVGSGNFIGLMPENARRDTYLTGIELDSITARIAGALYPQSNIVHSAFEKVALPDNTFDLNIGNPPFGNISLRMQYNPKHNGKSIHNQFFLGGMDALKPGGLQTMVVSRYLMDAQDASTREALALKAELLGAIRLPGSAFKGNAGTDVVTDILFLKKRSTAEQAELQDLWNSRSAKVPAKESYADRADRLAGQARLAQVLDWTTTAKVPDPLGGEAMQISKYFADNPKMVAGVMDRSGSMQFGGDIDVKLPASELAAKLDSLIAFLPEIKGESRSDEVNAKTEEMHRALGESMSIMASGREIGSIYYDESGALTEIVERVGVDGKTIVSKNTIDASTPWSSQLSMNMEGKWFKEVAQLDENGEKVKVGRKLNPKTGRLTVGRNVWVREVFANESDVPSGLRLGEEGFAKLKKLVGIRELYVEQINLETNSAQTEPMEANRTKLRAAYEAFVADHGYISEQKNAAIISEMPDEGLMLSLELKFRPAVTLSAAVKRGIKPSAARAEQNAILTRAVAIPPERKNNASSVSDAVAIVLGESGRIDVARVAELRGVTEDDALAELTGGDSPLAYMDPETNEVTEKNQYLSGNVRKKMVAARDAGLKRNVDALMKVQPEPWTSDKVTAHMGASWIPPEVYANFVKSLLGRDATVTFSQLSNTFEVSAPGSTAIDTSKWGTGRLPAVELLNDVLNSRRIAIYDGGGKDSPRVLNETETQSAIDKKKEIIEEFDNWIFKDGDRRQELTGLFNDKYNILVNRQYDGSHMEFPGKVPDSIIAFRRNQINAIWRGIVDRFTMYDHAVGAGKTFTGIARAMERKRMGLSNKPTIVVPNHLVSEWATQAYRLYPGAKILAAGAKDLEPKNRRRLFAKIAAGDWDLVIVPHSSFKFIGISPETEERFINDELRVAQDALKEAEDDAEPGQRFKPLSVKAAEALILKLENRMDVVRGKAGKDQLLTFEQMGIDDLTVDEAHEFKNLTYSTKLTDVRGLGPAAGSQKAFDLYTKMRILHETNGSAVFLTGTPISNSAVEMYTIMRYLAPDVLRESGLEHFDAFRAQYVQATEKPEPTEAGDGLKVVNRLGRNWSNMRSLMDGYYSVADVVTNDDIKAWFAEDNPGKVFPLPNVKGGGRRSVVAKPTPTQQLLIDELIAGYNGLPNIEDVRERNIARLRLMDKARKLALHAKVWDRTLTDEPGGKLDKVVDESFRLYKAFAAEKGTQLIFLDRSVPKAQGDDKQIKDYDSLRAKLTEANANGDENGQREAIEALEKFDPQEIDELRAAQAGGWNAYQHMADGLIAKGVPKEQIAFIQNFTTDAQKKALFEAVNDGSIRFLFGSSQRMGAGMNVQERLVGLHHVDVTWKPSDIEQREGRIIRQGNLFFTPPTADNPNPLYRADFEVEIMAYVTERSIDAKMWDLNSTKLRMVNGIRYYDGEFEMDFDDDAAIDMAEIAAIASGDPLMLERIKVNTIIEELYRKRRSYNRRVESAGDSLRRAEHDVETLPGEIAKKKALMAPIDDAFQKASSDQYSRRVMVGDKEFRSLEQALKHAEETILIAKEGDSKRQFALDIDGESFKSEAGVQDAITEKMGDISSFVAEIDGKKVIRRTAVARELRRLIGSEFTDIATTNVGSLFGFPFSMKTEKTRYGSFVDLSVKVPYEGGVETIAIAYDLTPEKHTKGTTVTVLTSTLRAALERLVDKMDSIRTDVYGIEYMQRNLKEATENIPTYREAVKEQFKQADELDAALTRLDDIQDQLQARAAAAAVTPVAPVADDDAAAFSRPRFSRGAQSQANESVERLATGIASHWDNAPKIVVAFDMNDPIIPENVRKEDQRLRSGADALKFLQKSTNKDIGRFGIATRDGQVRVLPRGDGVQVRVPKSKAQGARYFLDKNLIAVAGDFVSSANAMVANVDDAASAEKVLDMLMDKQALYALPSMADEAKSMASKPGPDGGPAALYSSADAALPAKPLSLDRVNQLVQEALSGIRGAPPVEVTARPGDIGLKVPAGSVGYGVTLRSGDIYVFQSAMGSDLDVFKTVFHELFHRGVRVLVPKAQYVQTMLDLAKGDSRIQQLAIEWKNTEMGQKQKDNLRQQGYTGAELTGQYEALAIEEALAAVAEEIKAEGRLGSKPKNITIRFLANWLAKVADLAGMKKLAQGIRTMTYNEAERFVMSAIDRSGEPVQAGRTDNLSAKQAARVGDQTQTENFRRWFGDSKVVDADGQPLVVYHGTASDVDAFNPQRSNSKSNTGAPAGTFFFSDKPDVASSYTVKWQGDFSATLHDGANVMPVYLSIEKPLKVSAKGESWREIEYKGQFYDINELTALAKESGRYDGLIVSRVRDKGVGSVTSKTATTYVAFRPEQVKSAIGNNGNFDPANADIRFRSLDSALTQAANSVRDVNLPAGYKVGDLFNAVPGKLNWWYRTLGTQYNLAQRSPAFKRVYDAVQTFINDVSYFATEAADMAPNILPKLESWKDLAKSPLSAADTKALSAPVFEGTLIWARDESGKAVKMETLEAKAKTMTPEQKAQRLLRGDHISEQMLKTWKGLPIDQYERLVNDKYEDSMLKAGIVFKDAELTALFGLSDKQIALYREFRKATDKSLANLAIADMLRFGGKDADPVRDVVLESKSVKDAADTLSKYLRSLADLDPDRATVLMDTANKMIDKGDKAQGLMDRGYAPLSRFGSYTLDVVDANGERAYFGMFESAAEASRMRRKMEGLYPGSRITQGTVSEQAYKMFAGVSPETLELFGDMLGLETQGDDTASQAFQEYLKLAKSSRSAMKRLIQRKGIAGFSEDAGRVLAGFVYSNARQTATSLHMGEMTQAAADNDAFRNQGETQDAAVKLVDYIKNPQEEAQKLRGLLFAQYIGGSVASAMVNMTQPITMTFPWLSQYGGVASAAKQMTAAIKDVGKPSTGDTKLDAALRKAEEDGTVSPQEVHQLLKQSQGRSALQSDDGTRAGYAMALAQNTVSRFSLVWGKLFSVAEQFNRRVTFIAAYRTAVAQGMADPDEFARKAISETQGVYNKGNKPAWARGAVGSTLFTFKQYSIAYVEMLSRMAKSGPEGKKAALLALAVLFLLSGAGGMPGADDLDDVISGAMQAMGYNFDSKMKRKEFFVSLLGEGGAQFVERGVSGLPGVPLDVSGRMGLGNLIPGTGLLTKKADHTRDVAEIAGPAGDFVKRGFDAAGKLITGNVAGAVNSIAPKAIQNVTQAFDMANMGMYRDTKGMKVLDTDMGDAVVKAIGFQPNDVKRAQDANSEVARMIGLNKIIETEIANRWAIGIFEKDTDKVQAARDDLAEWNRSNPESPIRINFTQIRSRVQKMNQTKAERIAKTAPREIRAAVRKELADAR